jgi:phenylpyruvate tautomerase PptA (4-oxalocrotonate tautomerase family)
MPVVTVEFVSDSDRPMRDGLAQALADAVGRVLGTPPGQTWVRLRSLQPNQYAENDTHLGASELPVFITLLERLPPTGAELQAQVTSLTQAIAQVFGRPSGCVHIEYASAASGRVSFGGRLVQ